VATISWIGSTDPVIGELDEVPASHIDLLNRPLVAVLTTVSSDGQPQSTAVWYLLDNDRLTVSVRTDRQKYRNVARDPRATFFVMDPGNTARTLELRCCVAVEPDPGKAHSEMFVPSYGSAPSIWDPEGTERAVLVLIPSRVVTVG
jgi:PPOX class probable F420-dependent enzyme